jgi:hypothetical protein
MGQENFRICIGPWTKAHSQIPTSTVSCGISHTTVMGIEKLSRVRRVKSLKGLMTIFVPCGVWHGVVVVEVIMTQTNASCGKLFIWKDGDKYHLGHSQNLNQLGFPH